MKFESGEGVKEYVSNFFIERCENQWMWERETCREEKVKKGSSTTHEWKDKKTGDVFIVSWILSFKAISFYII